MNFFSISAGVLDFDEKSSIAHTHTVDISCLGEKQTKNVFFGYFGHKPSEQAENWYMARSEHH